MHIRFAHDEEAGKQREEYAVEFAAFWRDQFGSVHFTAVPEDWWERWFDEHALGEREVADDEAGA